MPLSQAEANRVASKLLKDAGPEWARLRRFVRYSRGRQPLPWLPEGVDSEYRDIARKSASNWLDLVVRASSQGLNIDAYSNLETWTQAWQANGMDARQHALNDSVLICGYSYLIVFPSDDGQVAMVPVAATDMAACYTDPGDEWPEYALRQVKKETGGKGRWELYDEEARYTLTGTLGTATMEVLKHGAGVPPVVALRTSFDLLGMPMGEVEPVISIQDRIVDATFTLQMVAKYGAFPQRWIAGLNPGEPLRDSDGEPLLDGQGNPIMPTIKAYVDHILMAADVDTKFGQFAAADLRQYVEALEAHIRHLAAITQTPPHYLLGSLVNLSAEALAAAEAGLQRKIRSYREVLGEGYEQALRLAGSLLGIEGDDTSSQVHWQDIESRSLAQSADALGKLSALGVPLPMLLRMIPGFSQQDVEEAKQLIQSGNVLDQMLAQLEAAATSPEL